jgi:hypothetical protein
MTIVSGLSIDSTSVNHKLVPIFYYRIEKQKLDVGIKDGEENLKIIR